MESWVSLGGRESQTNIQIMAEPGTELETLEGRYPERMENWVSIGGEKSHTNIQILAELGIKPATLRLEGTDLTNCANKASR